MTGFIRYHWLFLTLLLIIAVVGGGYVGYYTGLVDARNYRQSDAFALDQLEKQIEQVDGKIKALDITSDFVEEEISDSAKNLRRGPSFQTQVLSLQLRQEDLVSYESDREALLREKEELEESKNLLLQGKELSFRAPLTKRIFSDVIYGELDSEVFTAIGTLKEMGVVKGNPDGSYGLNDPLNRASAATLLIRAFYPEVDLRSIVVTELPFSDVPKGIWYESALWFASQDQWKGKKKPVFMKGFQGKANPDDPVKIEEFVTMVLRILEISVDATDPWYESAITVSVSNGFMRSTDRGLIDQALIRGIVSRILFNALDYAGALPEAETIPIETKERELANPLEAVRTVVHEVSEERELQSKLQENVNYWDANPRSIPSSFRVKVVGGKLTPVQSTQIVHAFELLPPDFPKNVELTVNYSDPNMRNGMAGPGVIILKGQNERLFFQTLVHEAGHAYSLRKWGASGSPSSFSAGGSIPRSDPSVPYYSVSWSSNTSTKNDSFPSNYGKTNPFEDYAEGFIYYILQNKAFLQAADNDTQLAQKYDFMNLTFGGQDFVSFVDFLSRPYSIQQLSFDPAAYFSANP